MILNFFDEIVQIIHGFNDHVLVVSIYLSIAAAVIFLRILTKLRFSAALLAFRRDRRELKNRDEIKLFRNTLLRNIVAAYRQVADKAVTRIPTTQIIERQVESMGLLGWKFHSLATFVEGLENAFLWVGLLLAVVFGTYYA